MRARSGSTKRLSSQIRRIAREYILAHRADFGIERLSREYRAKTQNRCCEFYLDERIVFVHWRQLQK